MSRKKNARQGAFGKAPPDLVAMEALRIKRVKHEQGFDPDTPRCGTCIYYAQGSAAMRRLDIKRGRGIGHLQRCTFGNFHTTNLGLCNEWRNKAGECLGGSDG